MENRDADSIKSFISKHVKKVKIYVLIAALGIIILTNQIRVITGLGTIMGEVTLDWEFSQPPS